MPSFGGLLLGVALCMGFILQVLSAPTVVNAPDFSATNTISVDGKKFFLYSSCPARYAVYGHNQSFGNHRFRGLTPLFSGCGS